MKVTRHYQRKEYYFSYNCWSFELYKGWKIDLMSMYSSSYSDILNPKACSRHKLIITVAMVYNYSPHEEIIFFNYI